MRIAIAVTAGRGGMLHYAVQMADGLAARGHEVEVLVPRGHELSGHHGPATLREVLPLPVTDRAEPSLRAAYHARRVGVAARVLQAWGRVNVEARRKRCDAFIIAEGLDLLPAMLAAGLLTLGSRPRTVAYVCHNVRRYNRWGGEDLLLDPARDPMRLVYPRFDLVFVHGARSRDEFEATWPPVRLAEIPHGDERLFGTEPPAPSAQERILFFGHLRKVKGLPTLMAAFDALAERRPQVRLTIAGTPAPVDLDPEVVRRWAAGHGERVTLLDRYIAVEEVRPLFAAARVVCTPYDIGYQSGVVHLAQTMARAVVSSDVGDLREAVLDGQTGRLVAPGDVGALTDALHEVLADGALAARYGAAAHARVSTAASWETVAEAVEAALLPLVGRDQHPA